VLSIVIEAGGQRFPVGFDSADAAIFDEDAAAFDEALGIGIHRRGCGMDCGLPSLGQACGSYGGCGINL